MPLQRTRTVKCTPSTPPISCWGGWVWMHSVKLHTNYRPAQQAPLPLPPHLHWLRPNCCSQPAGFLHGKHCVWEEMTSEHQDLPQIHWKQMRTKRLSDVFWLRVGHSSASVAKTYDAKQSGLKTAFGTPLWSMSAGHKETPRDTTCQSGTVVFFSNPLMSGE